MYELVIFIVGIFTISLVIGIALLIPIFIVNIYALPYVLYCSTILTEDQYSNLPKVNFIKLFYLSTKCYLCWLTFKKPTKLN